MNKLLSKTDILSVNDNKFVDVDVPEWNGSVRIGTFSGSMRDKWETSLHKDGKLNFENIRARLIAYTAINEDGTPLFDESDLVNLGSKSARALDRLFDVAQELNGLGDKQVEDRAKK